MNQHDLLNLLKQALVVYELLEVAVAPVGGPLHPAPPLTVHLVVDVRGLCDERGHLEKVGGGWVQEHVEGGIAWKLKMDVCYIP